MNSDEAAEAEPGADRAAADEPVGAVDVVPVAPAPPWAFVDTSAADVPADVDADAAPLAAQTQTSPAAPYNYTLEAVVFTVIAAQKDAAIQSCFILK